MTSQAQQPSGKGKLQVHWPSDLEAEYVNFAMVSSSLSEVIIDFAQAMPRIPQAKVRTRVVMSPLNAKLLLQALGDHLARFEAQHGEIKLPEGGHLADQLFRGTGPDSPEEE